MKLCHFAFFVVLVVALSTTPAAAHQQKLTNKDIVKMVKASLPADVIVQAIKSSTPDFDVSADGLIALKQDGVPDSVIQAMVTRIAPPDTQPGPPPSTPFAQPDAGITSVFLVDGANRIQMKRASSTGMRMGGMGMAIVNPFGKVKSLMTFSAKHSQLRTSNDSPAFEASLPSDINPSDTIVLVRLSVKSDRREVSIGSSGVLGGSSGMNKNDILPISIDELPTQTTTGLSYRVYRVNCVKSLPAGEYAFVLHNAVFYDFGVDVSK